MRADCRGVGTLCSAAAANRLPRVVVVGPTNSRFVTRLTEAVKTVLVSTRRHSFGVSRAEYEFCTMPGEVAAGSQRSPCAASCRTSQRRCSTQVHYLDRRLLLLHAMATQLHSPKHRHLTEAPPAAAPGGQAARRQRLPIGSPTGATTGAGACKPLPGRAAPVLPVKHPTGVYIYHSPPLPPVPMLCAILIAGLASPAQPATTAKMVNTTSRQRRAFVHAWVAAAP
jgi:hypothetical protein